MAACPPQVIKRASTYSSSSAAVIEEKEEKRPVATTPATVAESKKCHRRRSSTGDLGLYKNGATELPEDNDDSSSDTVNTSSEKTQTPSDTASTEMDWELAGKKEQKNSVSGSEEKSAKVTLSGLSVVADKGNRLSQLEAPSETDGNAMSVVDVCYDL